MEILTLVKAQLGITHTARDEYLQAVIDSVERELEQMQGLSLKKDDPAHLMFICDMSVWRYQSAGQNEAMPERLRWRLRNMIVGGKNGNI